MLIDLNKIMLNLEIFIYLKIIFSNLIKKIIFMIQYVRVDVFFSYLIKFLKAFSILMKII